jgi:hypothetical protein
MRSAIRLLLIVTLLTLPAFARVRFFGWCEKGGVFATVNGLPSAQRLQQSFPGATVTVFTTGGAAGSVNTAGTLVSLLNGTIFNQNGQWNGAPITINSVSYNISSVAAGGRTLTLTSSAGVQSNVAYSMNGIAGAGALAPIYSDNSGTALANPFTCVAAASTLAGYYDFYADNSTLDIRFSGTGVTTPFTLAAVSGIDPLTAILNWPIYSSSVGTFASQCASAAATGSTLIVNQLASSLPTQTVSCALLFLGGGQLQAAAGATVTITGTIQAPDTQQIFDGSAAGATVKLSPACCNSAPFTWWGTNAAALNEALASGVNITAPCGAFSIGTSTVTIPRGVDFTSSRCTVFNYTGTGVAFLLTDSYQQHISISVTKTNPGFGTDTSSVGVQISAAANNVQENVFDFTITGFWTGALLTATGGDISDNLFTHVQASNNFISWDHRPASGHGTNQNTYTKFSANITSTNCPGGAPVAGTKYIYLEPGSNNFNSWINPEVQGPCAERLLDIRAVSDNTFYTPRFEAGTANSVYLASGSTRNQIYGPMINNGQYSSVMQDLGTNYIAGPFGTVIDTGGLTVPPLKISSNGSNLLTLSYSGAMTIPQDITSGGIASAALFQSNGASPIFYDAGFGAGATITGKGSYGKIVVGTGASASQGLVLYPQSYANGSTCFAWDNSARAAIALDSSTNYVVLYPSGGVPFVAGNTISFGCVGW